jgi:uncharacterized protein (TIGR02246 family)
MLAKRLFGLVLTACFYAMILAAQDASRSAERTAILDLVKQYVDSRDRQDEKAVEALFTGDADQLVSSGEWRKGRAAVVRGALNSSQQTGGKRTISVESIRFLTADVAVADGRYQLSQLAGNTTRDMWTTFVFTHAGGAWRIAAIRNMLPAAPVPVIASPPAPKRGY